MIMRIVTRRSSKKKPEQARHIANRLDAQRMQMKGQGCCLAMSKVPPT